jgi:hypothetical protein
LDPGVTSLEGAEERKSCWFDAEFSAAPQENLPGTSRMGSSMRSFDGSRYSQVDVVASALGLKGI